MAYRLLLIVCALTLFSAGAHAEAVSHDIPGRSPEVNQPFGFRAKGTAPTTVKGYPDLTPVLQLLPVNSRGKPTLVGLTKLTVTINSSFVFTTDIDAHGHTKGQLTAVLLGNGHLGVRFSNFDVTSILLVSTQSDGVFQTPPISIALAITDAQGVTSPLFSKPDLVITYKVKRGVATATAAH